MKKCLYLIISLLLAGPLFAQKGTIEAYSREDLLGKIGVPTAYSLPEFVEGHIYFNDATMTKAKMNVCAYDNSIRYIVGRDTLKLSSIANVNAVLTPENTFVYRDDMVLNLIRDEGSWALGEKKRLRLDEPKKGSSSGYGSVPASSSARTTSNDDFSSTETHTYGYLVSVDYTVSYDYYLVKEDGKVSKVKNVSTFTKAFPSLKDKIKSLAKMRKLDFSEKEDIVYLFEYCLTNLQ